MKKLAFTLAASLIATAAWSGPSYAAGGGSNSGGTKPVDCDDQNNTTTKEDEGCPDTDKESSLTDQDSLFEYGRALAYNGYHDNAIRVLHRAPDANDVRVLNMLGYAHRKSGRIDEAFEYYRTAVAIDPDYSLVREYLGEAYLQIGDLEAARGQLSQIERICDGKKCDEYSKLATLIIGHQITR